MKLIGTLNKLGKQINKEISRVNSGGCCVFAAAIATHLQQCCNVRLAVGDNETCHNSISKVREKVAKNTLAEWSRNGVQFGHVIVEFDYLGRTYHYDSNGVKKKADKTATLGYKLLDGFLTLNEATELGKCSKGWNDSFDRDQIPHLNDVIDTYLSPLWVN